MTKTKNNEVSFISKEDRLIFDYLNRRCGFQGSVEIEVFPNKKFIFMVYLRIQRGMYKDTNYHTYGNNLSNTLKQFEENAKEYFDR